MGNGVIIKRPTDSENHIEIFRSNDILLAFTNEPKFEPKNNRTLLDDKFLPESQTKPHPGLIRSTGEQHKCNNKNTTA